MKETSTRWNADGAEAGEKKYREESGVPMDIEQKRKSKGGV